MDLFCLLFWVLKLACIVIILAICSIFVIIYLAVPVFIGTNPWILPKCVFGNWGPKTKKPNPSNPGHFGLDNTRNFYLNVEEDVVIGAWHVLPQGEESRETKDEIDVETLNDGKDIFLYLHGKDRNRGTDIRVAMYKLLSALDFHVITIDYRGFGDSTGSPTEDGVVNDAYYTYKWLKERAENSRIFIWGHSLGSGVATKLAKRLSDEGDCLAGLVLEAPFNNLRDISMNHRYLKPYKAVPGLIDKLFVGGLKRRGICFSSDENIQDVKANIMILHAEDDVVIPFHQGEKLYKKALETRSEDAGDVEFISFTGCGHNYIHADPSLPDIIRNFVAKSN